MMHILNMHGPKFLFFYAIVGAVTLLWMWLQIRTQEARWPLPLIKLTDPYKIALLRGGENEALRIAALSLVDRGLLEVDGKTMRTKKNAAVESVRRPIEIAILRKFISAAEAHEMFADRSLIAACEEYRESLARHRLIVNEKVHASRRPSLILGVVVLAGLAGAKIFVALGAGHTNVGFLLILAAFFVSFLLKFYNRERTGLGDRVLEDLRSLFKGLRDRGQSLKPGGATNEAALLAAVFGVSALSVTSFPYIGELFPKAAKSGSSCSSGACGFSCGSSCGGSGGGCGGCGG